MRESNTSWVEVNSNQRIVINLLEQDLQDVIAYPNTTVQITVTNKLASPEAYTVID